MDDLLCGKEVSCKTNVPSLYAPPWIPNLSSMLTLN